MKVAWTRRPPEPREAAAAGLVGAAVGVATGLVAFYLARLLLSRDEVRLEPPEKGEGAEGG